MNSTDFEYQFAASVLFLLLIALVAINQFGVGPVAQILFTGVTCLFAVSTTIIAWRVGTWRIAVPLAFILASGCARELIIAGQAAMPFGDMVVPGYPWYLTREAYFGICCSLLAIGFGLAAMIFLAREPEWMRDLLD